MSIKAYGSSYDQARYWIEHASEEAIIGFGIRSTDLGFKKAASDKLKELGSNVAILITGFSINV